jgi:hypothetical protein
MQHSVKKDFLQVGKNKCSCPIVHEMIALLEEISVLFCSVIDALIHRVVP